MNTYAITVSNDMMQQFCVKAENVVEALEKAKTIFKENMVTADDNGTKTRKPLSERKVIRTVFEACQHTNILNPTENELRKTKLQSIKENMPD